MNLHQVSAPVFNERIERKFQLGVQGSKIAGISDDSYFSSFLTECSPSDHSALTPTTGRVA